MRTVFEDTDVTANLADAKANDRGKYVPLVLWIFATLLFIGSWKTYQWAYNRKPPPPPPPAASLQDAKQIGQLAQKFNQFAQGGNWVEAQKLLTTDAQQKLIFTKLRRYFISSYSVSHQTAALTFLFLKYSAGR